MQIRLVVADKQLYCLYNVIFIHCSYIVAERKIWKLNTRLGVNALDENIVPTTCDLERLFFSSIFTMIWYVLVVTLSCVAGIYERAGDQLFDLSQYSYVQNEFEFTSTNDAGTAEMDVFRLPKNVLPVSYNLTVATDFESFTYSGQVDIVVHASLKTSQIVLNAKDIKVTGVEVIDQASNDLLTVDDHYLVDKNEHLIIVLNHSSGGLIPLRSYIVKITFEASLRDDLDGFYKSSYKENNVTKYCIYILL